MRHAKILVVDDDRDLLGVISAMLSRLGHDVSLADSGEKGLVAFFKNPFNIVLSDYQMPGMDGIALACAIKKKIPPYTGPDHDGCRKGNRFIQKEPRGG